MWQGYRHDSWGHFGVLFVQTHKPLPFSQGSWESVLSWPRFLYRRAVKDRFNLNNSVIDTAGSRYHIEPSVIHNRKSYMYASVVPRMYKSITQRVKCKHFFSHLHAPKTSDLRGSAWQTSGRSCTACARSISAKHDQKEVKTHPEIDKACLSHESHPRGTAATRSLRQDLPRFAWTRRSLWVVE